MPGTLVVEERVGGSETISELGRRGHAVSVQPASVQGRLSAVANDPGAGQLGAGGNPRGMQECAGGRNGTLRSKVSGIIM